MRLPFLVSGVLILMLQVISLASDQSPALTSSIHSNPASAINGAGVVNPLLSETTTGPSRQWSVDVLLGLPVGIRIQHGLGSAPDPC